MFSILVSGLHAYSQNPYPQEYDGYRSWSTFNQDTVRYLQYNWGLKVVGVYNDVPLSDFFDVFELPICDVEIRCTTPGGRAEVGYIQFWLRPYEKAYKEYQSALRRFNNSLKDLARVLRLNSPVTSYTFRHSWATTAKYRGVPIEMISESLGHKSIKTTQIYLKGFGLRERTEVNRKNLSYVRNYNVSR